MEFEQFLDYKQKYQTHSRQLFIPFLYTLFPLHVHSHHGLSKIIHIPKLYTHPSIFTADILCTCSTNCLSICMTQTKFPGVDHFYRKSGSWGTIFPQKILVWGTKIFRTKIPVTVQIHQSDYSLRGIHWIPQDIASYPGLLTQHLSLAILTWGKAW